MHDWKIVLRCPVSCVVSNLFSKETGWALAAFFGEVVRMKSTDERGLNLLICLYKLSFCGCSASHDTCKPLVLELKAATTNDLCAFVPILVCDKSVNLVSLIERCQIKLRLSPFVRSPQLTAAPRSQLCCVITIWNQLADSLQAFNRFFFV